MKPDSIIKSIVHAVKSREELSGVVCIYSDSRETAENPLCAFTLCVGLGKTEFNRNIENSEYISEVKLCLLAPTGAGGKRLSEMSVWIGEAVREAVNASSIEISEPRFSDTSSTLFTDISVKVEDVNFMDTRCKFYVDDVLFDGLICFNVESSEEIGKQPELLNGYSVLGSGKTNYSIQLKTKSILKLQENSELRFDTASFSEVYYGCGVNKVTRVMTGLGEVTFSYVIRAEGRKLSETEVQDEY